MSNSVEDISVAEARWLRTLHPLLPESASRKAWTYLLESYTGTGRHYHALAHLNTMFGVLDSHPESAPDPVVLAAAVWFHDAVYNPLRPDNEARSAEAARKYLQGAALTSEQLRRIQHLIRRTQHHAATEPQDALDTALLLDADLWVLGGEPAAYARYARQVRQEYRLVPDALFRPGRIKVLTPLLEAPQLYRTKYAREQRDAAARRNLAAERRLWESGADIQEWQGE